MLSVILTAATVTIPLVASVAIAVEVGRLLSRGGTVIEHVAWWVAVLGSSTVVFVGLERFGRRFLPLAALFKMTMLFPDQAPKRLKVAWRSGSVRRLERNANGEIGTVPSDAASEILALAASLSRHDRATRGHSERVRALTDMIAEELHLSTDDRDRLRWSALLHDVGKLGVHPHTLNKSGKLTDEEWAEVRNHPLEGRRLIAPLAPWLGEWSLVIEQHHECYDGSGYPFGLSGHQLSLGARIVSVADSFEVMTAVRSYKKAIGVSAARKELTRCAGTQFDPAIVRAFLNTSLGRLRWTVSPLSWIADIPFVARLGLVGRAVATAGQAALGATAVTVGSALAWHAAAIHGSLSNDFSHASHAVSVDHRIGAGAPTVATSDTRYRSKHRAAGDERLDHTKKVGSTSSHDTRGSAATGPHSTPASATSSDPSSTTVPTKSAGSGPSPVTTTIAPSGTPSTTTVLPVVTLTIPPAVTTTTTRPSSSTTTTTTSTTTTTRPPTSTTTTTTTTTTTIPPTTTTTTPRGLCLPLLGCLL